MDAIELMEHMIAMHRDEAAGLRRIWPQGAVVTIDDLHTLAGKTMSQREVGLLFRAALARGTRLACAVGRLAEIPVLVEGVRSLPAARIVPLRRPNNPQMRQIVRGLARTEGVLLPARKLNSIAGRCHGDVRRALGAIACQRLQASAG
jgi:chromosomal replication initiation ATPase DnaA